MVGEDRYDPWFFADDMLGRLARWLRIAGYDTVYHRRIRDVELIDGALREKRIILTRDRKLGLRKLAPTHLIIRYDHYPDQLAQVIEELNLTLDPERFFTRCVLCNLLVEAAAKEEVKTLVPSYVYQTQNYFHRCPSCRRIYWPGTHLEEVKKIAAGLCKPGRP